MPYGAQWGAGVFVAALGEALLHDPATRPSITATIGGDTIDLNPGWGGR